jgi:hypothetical protein
MMFDDKRGTTTYLQATIAHIEKNPKPMKHGRKLLSWTPNSKISKGF